MATTCEATSGTDKAQATQVTSAKADEAKELTPEKKAKLGKLETVISKGHKAYLAMCRAFLQIEEEDLYLPHNSLTAYCGYRWDMKPCDVSRCKAAAEVLVNLDGAGVTKLPANQSQARELQHLKGEDQVTAWNAVLSRVKRGKRITAKFIRQVVGELFPAEKKEQEPQRRTELNFRPVLEGLQSLDAEVARNDISPEDREALREQLKAAEELLARIKSQIG